jgi:hypothetical protein
MSCITSGDDDEGVSIGLRVDADILSNLLKVDEEIAPAQRAAISIQPFPSSGQRMWYAVKKKKEADKL